MAAVDRELASRLGREGVARGVEEIDEREPLLRGDVASGVAIERQILVLSVGIGHERIARGLDGDRRHDHEPRRRFGLVTRILRGQLTEQIEIVGLKFLHAAGAGERLIESEEEQVGVGAEGSHRIVELRVVAGPLPVGNFVGRPGDVPHDEFLVGKALVQERLEVPEDVHPLGGRIAIDRDPLAVDELERQSARGQGRARRPPSGSKQLAGRLERVGLFRGSGRSVGLLRLGGPGGLGSDRYEQQQRGQAK